MKQQLSGIAAPGVTLRPKTASRHPGWYDPAEASTPTVQLEISLKTLEGLLNEGTLVVEKFRCLNPDTKRRVKRAVLCSLRAKDL